MLEVGDDCESDDELNAVEIQIDRRKEGIAHDSRAHFLVDARVVASNHSF